MGAPRFAVVVAVLASAALTLGCSDTTQPVDEPLPPPAEIVDEATDARPWSTAEPEDVGLRPARLRALARSARRLDSTCFVVVRDGKVALESNWGMESTQPREVWSITKSVTSALVGIAVRDGDLDLDDRVSRFVPQWRGTASARVTVRNLLSNDSGRFWSMQTDYGALVQAPDRTSYAVGLPQQHPPGTAWAYNNAAIQVLDRVLRKATGTPVADFARERLFEPLGMSDTRLTTDPSRRTAAVFYGMQTTCLDVARFGMLYLGEGAVDGTRLLSRSYVQQSVGQPSTTHNAAYGFLWWLNRPGRLRGATDPVDALGQPLQPRSGQLAPGAPPYLYAAQGLGGQVLLVDPRSRTLVVRLGRLRQGAPRLYDFADAAAVVTTAMRGQSERQPG